MGLLTNKGLTGYSQYGQKVSYKLIPFGRTVVFETPIELPTTEPANANVTMEVLATDVPTCQPAGFDINAAGSSTYSTIYSTMYQLFFVNSTGINQTLYCKYVTNPATPSWSAASSNTINPSSTPRYPVAWCYGMGTYHAVGVLQQFKLWASAAGVTCTAISKTVVHNAITTLNEEGVADLKISLVKDADYLGKSSGAGQAFTFRASYPTGGSTVNEYSAALDNNYIASPLRLPFCSPNLTLGFGSPYIVTYQLYNNTSDVAAARLCLGEISYRRIR